MLTKNFYSFIRAAFQKVSAEFTTTEGSTKSDIISNEKAPFTIMNNWAKNVNYSGVSFGTGTTPATVSDYFLESILYEAQISVSNPSTVSFSRGDTYDEYTATFGVTNETTDAITISEVGLSAVANKTIATNPCVLVDRTVLDAPITIPAGESKQITYTIRFNYGA